MKKITNKLETINQGFGSVEHVVIYMPSYLYNVIFNGSQSAEKFILSFQENRIINSTFK